MKQLEHCGKVFDEDTDWVRYLREAIRYDGAVPGLRDDLSLRGGLGELYEALQGTPMQAAMASATLLLFETGTRRERDIMCALPYEEAPGAKERLRRLLEQDRDRLTQSDVNGLLHGLLEKNLDDPEVKAMLQRELERPDSKLTDLGLAARHLPDWFLDHLLSLRLPPDTDGMELLAWLVRIPESKQLALLDRIASLGHSYVDDMVARQLEPWWTQDERKQREALFRAHPVFRQALAEALKTPRT
jgi:hypothetical protein